MRDRKNLFETIIGAVEFPSTTLRKCGLNYGPLDAKAVSVIIILSLDELNEIWDLKHVGAKIMAQSRSDFGDVC